MWQTYHTPVSLEEALDLLAEHAPRARLIAGGTDLLVELRQNPRPDLALIDLSRVEGLDRIERDAVGLIHIGPGLTHNQAAASELLQAGGFPLAQACRQVGTPPLRNRATIAGNLITASPANDTITALWALDGRLTLRSRRGQRTLALPDFYQGVRRTALTPDEVVSDIVFPAMAANQRGVFVKLALRRAHAIALVNAAMVLTFDGPLVTQARITLGSVAPTIIRAPQAEAALCGQPLSDSCIAQAADLAAQAAAPINDVRGGADYRRQMAAVLVQRGLTSLCDGNERAAQLARPPRLWGQSDGHFPAGQLDHGVSHTEQNQQAIRCTVNGRPVSVVGAHNKTLLAMLRDDLGLTGSKEGCGEGECGACTVWLDGLAVFACLVPAPRAHGAAITTIEDMAQGEALHPVQQAFIDEGAVQCGYCTPGFVMAAANLLEEIPQPSREQIEAGLTGNLCRCTGYYKIVRAIEKAARQPAVGGQNA